MDLQWSMKLFSMAMSLTFRLCDYLGREMVNQNISNMTWMESFGSSIARSKIYQSDSQVVGSVDLDFRSYQFELSLFENTEQMEVNR
jgi:hypothetical protein